MTTENKATQTTEPAIAVEPVLADVVFIKDVSFKMGETVFKIYDKFYGIIHCLYVGTDNKRKLIIGQALPDRENIEIPFDAEIEIVKIDNFNEWFAYNFG